MLTIEQLKESLKGHSAEEAIAILTSFIEENPSHPLIDEALTLRGMKYWGLQNRSAAINDYLAAIRHNPDSKAKLALKAANEILDYYNKDLYNP